MSGEGSYARCDATYKSWLCDRPVEHPLPHVAQMGGDRALRWGKATIGCYEPDCVRDPGHVVWHNDGKGKSWAQDDSCHPPTTANGGPAASDTPNGETLANPATPVQNKNT